MIHYRVGYLFAFSLLLLSLSSASQALNLTAGMEAFHDFAPGDRLQGEVVLANTTGKAENVKVYLEDYLFRHDGTNEFPPAGTSPRSNAKWIKFSPERLLIRPNGTERIRYEITVPADGDFDGSYWSLLMIEPMEEDDPTLASTDLKARKPAVGVRTQLRYAFQIVTTRKNTGKLKLKFVGRSLKEETKDRLVYYIDIENNGSLFARPKVWVEIFDGTGKSTGKYSAGQRQILPGCSTRFSATLDGLSKGKYKALVVADTGENMIGGKFDLIVGAAK